MTGSDRKVYFYERSINYFSSIDVCAYLRSWVFVVWYEPLWGNISFIHNHNAANTHMWNRTK